MRMPRMEMDWKVTPQFFLSAANLFAILISVVLFLGRTTGQVDDNKKTIDAMREKHEKAVAELRAEISQLRSQDTAIAVIKTDLSYVKDSVQDVKNSMARIEQRIDGKTVR